MNTWGILLQIALVLAALMAGCSLARQGVVSASASVQVGAFTARILDRILIVDLVKVYEGKYFYRLVVLPVGQ